MGEFNLGSLTSGLLKHTVAGGVSTPATATPGTDYVVPVPAAVEDNFASFDADGNPQDSGYSGTDFAASTLDAVLADLEWTGTTRTLGVSGTVAVGDWCMLVDSTGTGLWGKVDVSDATKICLGVCVAVSGTDRTVLLSGRYRNDTLYAALTTAGVTVFRHVDTDGAFQVTTPAGSGKVQQVLGLVESSKLLFINPSMNTFTIA